MVRRRRAPPYGGGLAAALAVALALLLLGRAADASSIVVPFELGSEAAAAAAAEQKGPSHLRGSGSGDSSGGSSSDALMIRQRRLQPSPDEPAPTPAGSSSVGSGVYTAEALADEITALPGLSPEDGRKLAFKQFSGYLPISSSNKNIFYWFVEAAEDPEKAPLVFWTNGGPGCSGLYGAFNEQGPFRPTKGGAALQLNPYSWNRVANMLYVEQPVSVGFSYTTSEVENKQFGDNQAAADNYKLIQAFLARFPHLRDRDFHLSGESYAGHYLPALARYIVERNEEQAGQGGDQALRINLKGFLVGNPSTDPVQQLIGQVETLWRHKRLPRGLYDRWLAECVAPSTGTPPTLEQLEGPRCLAVQRQILQATLDLDMYAISHPPCADGPLQPGQTSFLLSLIASGPVGSRLPLLTEAAKAAMVPTDGPPGLRHPHHHHRRGLLLLNETIDGPAPTPLAYEPCQSAYTAAYLNRPDVKAAIHAEPSIAWADCSAHVLDHYDRGDWEAYMEPTFRFLVEKYKALRILLYSGDDDTVCSTLGTERWLEAMAWRTREDWAPWSAPGAKAPAGQMKTYDNGVMFMTVSGAGHEVPAFKPREALFLFSQYLQGGIRED